MTDNKKKYQKPKMSVIGLVNTDLICTSGNGRSLNPYQGDEWSDD